jgi:hypothetical protein
MFNNLFSRQTTVQSTEAPETTYIEVAGLMDDFMSLEDVAPGSDYADLLAASWGVPSTTVNPEAHPSVNLKSAAAKVIRSLFQASRSKLEVA